MRVELHENVVSVDYLEDSTLHYFTYATEWTDREHVLEFETPEKAIEWYKKNLTSRCIDQGKWWAHEDGEENIDNEEAMNEWETIVECVMYC